MTKLNMNMDISDDMGETNDARKASIKKLDMYYRSPQPGGVTSAGVKSSKRSLFNESAHKVSNVNLNKFEASELGTMISSP